MKSHLVIMHTASFQFCSNAKIYNPVYNTHHTRGDNVSASVQLAAVLDRSVG